MASLKIFVIVCSLVGFVFSECDIPPQFWCDNPQVAEQCEVSHQCQGYLQRAQSESAPPVEFSLYYENLCPFCQRFIVDILLPVYKDIHSIMNLTLVPFGNAEETSIGGGLYKFTCQHGQTECLGNIIETCAIHFLKDASVYLPLIACMEASESPLPAFKQCAKKYHIPTKKILACSTSHLGNHLEHGMALETQAAFSGVRIQYVPWVTLNGIHTKDIQDAAFKDLTKLICTTYKGSPKPAACSSV